jgi:hypothetical protein
MIAFLWHQIVHPATMITFLKISELNWRWYISCTERDVFHYILTNLQHHLLNGHLKKRGISLSSTFMVKSADDDQIWHSVKSDIPDFQTGRSGFYGYKIIIIFKWRLVLYISQVGHIVIFFRLCKCFLDNLVEFHSRNKELLEMTIIWT